jgi:hypothetical protein
VRPRCLAALLVLAGSAHAEAPAFKEGDVLGYADVAKLERFLPPEFWAHRELFFYEGMQLEIGPTQRDYSPAAEYVAATEQFAGQTKLRSDGTLEGFVAGQPFPMERIDCLGDPDAGIKIAWNFDQQWEGDGGNGWFRLSYLDRGEALPLAIQGSFAEIERAHRVEWRKLVRERERSTHEDRDRTAGAGVDLARTEDEPLLQVYRYKRKNVARSPDSWHDHWVWDPVRRELTRYGDKFRTVAIAGTDLTLDDWGSFSGAVPEQRWECLGEGTLIAPMNTTRLGFPYGGEHDFGPYGASYASDRWEIRRAVRIRLVPKAPDHPYSRKDLWVDAQTLVPLYAFAYDRKDALWKILWHDHRWSEDTLPQDRGRWYPGWAGVGEPRDLRVVSDTIANVQTGSVTRVDFWEANGTPRRPHHEIDLRRFDASPSR